MEATGRTEIGPIESGHFLHLRTFSCVGGISAGRPSSKFISQAWYDVPVGINDSPVSGKQGLSGITKLLLVVPLGAEM